MTCPCPILFAPVPLGSASARRPRATNASRPKRASERIYPRVAPPLAQRLAQHAAASGISETAVVEAALERYLDGAPTDTALIMARLDRLGRAHERSQRDQMLHAEAFVAYVNMWFAKTSRAATSRRRRR